MRILKTLNNNIWVYIKLIKSIKKHFENQSVFLSPFFIVYSTAIANVKVFKSVTATETSTIETVITSL